MLKVDPDEFQLDLQYFQNQLVLCLTLQCSSLFFVDVVSDLLRSLKKFLFYFRSFEISENIMGIQKLVFCLEPFSRQYFSFYPHYRI